MIQCIHLKLHVYILLIQLFTREKIQNRNIA